MNLIFEHKKTLNRPERLKDNKLSPLYMERLPLGNVNCGGWLRTQLELMCEGITGRLPEYGPFFTKEKNGYLYPEADKGWEEVPYWFRGFYPLAVLTQNEKHLATAKTYIEAFIASAQPDGWFGPAYLKEYEKLDDGTPVPDFSPPCSCWIPLSCIMRFRGMNAFRSSSAAFSAFAKMSPTRHLCLQD